MTVSLLPPPHMHTAYHGYSGVWQRQVTKMHQSVLCYCVQLYCLLLQSHTDLKSKGREKQDADNNTSKVNEVYIYYTHTCTHMHTHAHTHTQTFIGTHTHTQKTQPHGNNMVQLKNIKSHEIHFQTSADEKVE